MKTVLVSAFLMTLSLGVAAQTAPKAPAKENARAARHKPARHVEPVAAPVPPAPPLPLGEAELDIARRVFVGYLPCELGASVTLERHPQADGYFRLHLGKQTFQMAPVATTTGAIRLEDRHAGAVWLQLANKSMLVSDRLGKRLVDACMNPEQVRVAEEMQRSPVRSVLDDPMPPDGAVARK